MRFQARTPQRFSPSTMHTESRSAIHATKSSHNQSCHWTSETQHALPTRATRDFPSPFTHTETLRLCNDAYYATAGASLCVMERENREWLGYLWWRERAAFRTFSGNSAHDSQARLCVRSGGGKSLWCPGSKSHWARRRWQ